MHCTSSYTAGDYGEWPAIVTVSNAAVIATIEFVRPLTTTGDDLWSPINLRWLLAAGGAARTHSASVSASAVGAASAGRIACGRADFLAVA